MVICTTRGTHAPTSEIHTQELVVHALACGHRNEALSRTPGSWNADDAGEGACSGRRLMRRTKSGFESVELQDSKKPAGGTSKVTIHNDEMSEKRG